MSKYKFIGEEGAKAILSRIKNLENSWTSAGGGATSTVRNTASGESIVLTDSAESKLEGLKVYGRSEQNTTTGANLLDLTGSVPPSIVSNGITITIPEDGSYTFRGTATGSAINVWFLGGYSTELPTLFTLPAGTYYISGVLIFTGQSCLNSSLSVENPSGIFTIQSDFNVTGVRALKAVEGKEYDTVIYPIIAKSDTAIPWEPYTGCVATPNPKYTQKISSIGESIRENLFDPENVLDGYYFTGQDSVLRRSDGLATVYCKCDPNTTYTVSKISGVRFVVAYTTDEPANGAAIYGNIQKYHNKSITITTGSDAKYLVAYVHHSAQDPVSRERMLASIKIEEGPDATPYVPYNSEELGGKVYVGGYGGNLAKTIYVSSETTAYSNALYAEIDGFSPNTEYTISFIGTNGHSCYTNENLFTKSTSFKCTGSRQSITVKTLDTYPSNYTTYVAGKGWLLFKHLDAISTATLFKDVQIELGNKSSDYEPYKASQPLAIATPNGLPGIKVTDATIATYTDAEGNMWCADEIDFGRGVYVQRIKTFYIDSTKNPTEFGDGTSGVTLQYDLGANWLPDGKLKVETGSTMVISDTFGPIKLTHNWNSYDNTILLGGTYKNKCQISVSSEIATSASEFRTWLGDKVITVLFALETPIETPLSAEEIAAYQALHTNYPTTTLLNDSGAHMEVTYGADTKNYIDNKFKELSTALIALGGI